SGDSRADGAYIIRSLRAEAGGASIHRRPREAGLRFGITKRLAFPRLTRDNQPASQAGERHPSKVHTQPKLYDSRLREKGGGGHLPKGRRRVDGARNLECRRIGQVEGLGAKFEFVFLAQIEILE